MPTIEVGTNSYIDRADAESFLGERLYTEAWDDASESQQETALIMATRAIDRLLLVGRPVDEEQELAFPRRSQGWEQLNVPKAVRDATCEEALAILDTDHEFRRNLRNAGVTSTSVGNVREGFANRSMRHGGMIEPKGLRSLEARQLMKPWVAGSVAIR